jgi:hypothetical protein
MENARYAKTPTPRTRVKTKLNNEGPRWEGGVESVIKG